MMSNTNHSGIGMTSQRTRMRMVERLRQQGIRDEIVLSRLREREVESRIVTSDGEIDNYLNINVDGNSFGYGGTVPWLGLQSAGLGVPVEITSLIWGAPTITIPAGGQYPDPGFELLFGWTIRQSEQVPRESTE